MAFIPLGSAASRWIPAGRGVRRARWYYGWTVVAVAFCTVGAGGGLRSAFGVLLVPLASGLGWGRAVPSTAIAVSGVPALVDAGYPPARVAAQVGLSGVGIALCMPLLGYLADRWTAEIAYPLGSLALMGALGVLYVAAPGQDVLLDLYTVLFALGFASR
jgi:hypothetical protein